MTRAIIEGMVDNFHYRVRIPVLNKIAAAVGATPVEELAIATVAVAPGVSPKFRSGDVVFVEFEEGDTSKPVVVGLMFNTLEASVVSDAKFDSLSISVNTTLQRDTTIGEVTADNIANLMGLNTNAQYEFNKNNNEHDKFVSQISDIKADIDEINQDINSIHKVDERQDREIDRVEDRVTNIETKMSGPLILNSISYGKEDPKKITGAKEGQVYLWIQNEA